MILNKPGEEWSDNGTSYSIGRPVRASCGSEYPGLFGTIEEIRTDADSSSGDEAPDICCMDETVEVDEAVDSGNAGALVAGIVGGFLAYAVIGGAKKLWGFAGAKLAERKAARKAGTDAVDVEYTDVEETAEDSDEGNSEK